MFLYSNSAETFSRSQSFQNPQMLLVFASLLMLSVIVYVHQWQLAELSEDKTKIFALKVDKSAEPTFKEKFLNLTKELPTLPFEFVQQNGFRKFRISRGCAHFPDIFTLELLNNFWQTYRNGKLLVRLYGAYYDNRLLDQSTPVVRLLVLINQMTPPEPKDFCQIWFEHTTKPTIAKIAEYKPIWQSSWTQSTKLLYPFVLTCVLPAKDKYAIPKAISLVAQPCEHAGNVLKVYYEAIKNITSKQTFGVCVKGLSHPLSDLSLNLIEWLEILGKFGIGKVHFSIFEVHPNVRKVINYYENLSYVQSRLMTIGNMAVALPFLQPVLLQNDQRNRRFHDAVIAHDCFYRNLYSFDYMALLDIDLVPLPLPVFNSWHAVLNYASRQSSCKNLTRICLRNVPTGATKRAKIKIDENAKVPTFLSNQIWDKRFYFDNVTHITCWHSTNFGLLMDDAFLRKSNDCSFKLKTNLAQLLHFHLSNEHPANDTQNSKLTGVRSLLKSRVAQIANELKLN